MAQRRVIVKRGTKTTGDSPQPRKSVDIQKDIRQDEVDVSNESSSLAQEVLEEMSDRPVYYVGDTGHMDIHPGDYIYGANGKKIGEEPPLHIDFGVGHGRTKPLNPNDPADAEYIGRVDAWIAEGKDPRIARLKIRKLEPDQTPPPFANWLTLNTKTLKTMVTNMLVGESESDKATLKSYAQFELEQASPRQDVLDMLDGLVYEPSDEDILSADIEM